MTFTHVSLVQRLILIHLDLYVIQFNFVKELKDIIQFLILSSVISDIY